MKDLKTTLFESVTQDKNVNLEYFCESIQNWAINEFAPEIQNWIIKEFSLQIEKWVKEYMNDKRIPLHIADLCKESDEDKCGQCVASKSEEEKPSRKMGTVEPEYNDAKHILTDGGYIQDDALAFIYGAIKKYGQYPELFSELKDYIIKEAKYIGE